MSIERAEKLKALLTDKYVLVDAAIPELKRFQNWTGKVRTVNMNCRALVEFDGPVDIGWYDIDPDYLKVVDAPVKRAPAPPAKAAPAATASTEAKPAAKPAPTAGKSPLDAIRAQQAAKAAGTAPAAAAAPAVGAKLSPLDMIRKQQAAKAAGAAPAAAAPAPAPVVEVAPPAQAAAPVSPAPAPEPVAAKPIPTTGPDGKPLSKLDMIRMQGAAKK